MGIKLNAKVKVKHSFKNFNTINNKLIGTVSESIEDIIKN